MKNVLVLFVVLSMLGFKTIYLTHAVMTLLSLYVVIVVVSGLLMKRRKNE
jgi:hypothetical protein